MIVRAANNEYGVGARRAGYHHGHMRRYGRGRGRFANVRYGILVLVVVVDVAVTVTEVPMAQFGLLNRIVEALLQLGGEKATARSDAACIGRI